jgi:hypothetical protein
MSQPKYAVQRARVHLEEYNTGVLDDLFNVDAMSVSASEEVIKKQSTTEVIGDIAIKRISNSWEGTMTLGSTDMDNFIRNTRSKESTQAAVAEGTFVFPAGAQGKSFKLPHGKVTAVAVPGLTVNVDYTVLKASGIVTRLRDFEADVPGGTYAAGTARIAGIGAGEDKYYALHVTDELNGEYTQWFKVQLKLPSSLQYIKPSEFGTFEVAFTLLQDQTRPVSGDYGQYGIRLEA